MIYSFCPKCGSTYSDQQNDEVFSCSNCGFIFYRNSKPTASTLIVRDGKVLLGKRRYEPEKGLWDVIGGFLNLSEHPKEGAKREAKEETGYDIEIESLLGIFMDTYKYASASDATLNICYIAKIIGGEAQPNDDIEELGWFALHELPEKIAFKNGRDMLNAWLASIR